MCPPASSRRVGGRCWTLHTTRETFRRILRAAHFSWKVPTTKSTVLLCSRCRLEARDVCAWLEQEVVCAMSIGFQAITYENNYFYLVVGR